jgi:hypothetical protein
LKFTFDEPTEVSKYTVEAAGNPVVAFVDWRFEASNDNTNWITLDSQTGQNTVCKNEIQPKVYQVGCTDSTEFKCRHGHYGNITACTPWKKCNVGFKRVNGTGTSDAICLPCEEGTFQPSNNFLGNNCTNWKICDSNEYISIEGTNSSDRICKTIPIITTTTTSAATTAFSASTTTNGAKTTTSATTRAATTTTRAATTTTRAAATTTRAATTTFSASTTINSVSTTTNATKTTTTTKMMVNATTNGTIAVTTTKNISTNATLAAPPTTLAPVLAVDTQITTIKPTSRGRNPSNKIDGDEEEDVLSIATYDASSLCVMLLISIITTSLTLNAIYL